MLWAGAEENPRSELLKLLGYSPAEAEAAAGAPEPSPVEAAPAQPSPVMAAFDGASSAELGWSIQQRTLYFCSVGNPNVYFA